MRGQRAIGGWWLSAHAARRAYERQVGDHEIAAALDRPTSVVDQGLDHPGCTLYRRGSIAVAVHPMSKQIITVLFGHQNLELDLAPRRRRQRGAHHRY